MFVYFYSYLHVLDVFRSFVSCQAALQFCKCCCREQPKSIENDAQIHQNRSQNQSKSTKVVPRNAPKATLGASWYSTRLPKQALHRARNLRFWAPLGRFWVPFGPQLGAKGDSKSGFLVPGCAKILKNDIQDKACEKV